MDNTFLIALLAGIAGAVPSIIGLLLLRGKVATNAKQVTVDIQATQVEREKIVNDFAGEAFKLNDRLHEEKDINRKITERIVFLEKREIEREASDKKRDEEQKLREAEYNTKLTELNTTLQKAYAEIQETSALLKRAYTEITNLNKQIAVLVQQKSELTGQAEPKPPTGDKDIQAKAQAASGETAPTLPPGEGVTLPVKGTVTLTQTGTEPTP